MATISRQKSDQMIEALDPFHTQVGRIASQWAALDHAIDQTIWLLAEVTPALGACITTQLTSTSARIRVLHALLLLRDGSDAIIAKLNRFNAKMYSALEKRNRAVHDPWGIDDASGSVSQIRVALVNKEIRLEEVPIQMAELFSDLRLVSRQLNTFMVVRAEILSWLEASPQKWREPLPQISLFEMATVDP